MQLKDMKPGDIGVINFGHGKEIVMRSWVEWPESGLYFYILCSENHESGDAYDKETYQNYQYQEIKQLKLKFDPNILT